MMKYGFKKQINDILMASISYMDSLESFYHGMMVGILAGLKGCRIVSNRESGGADQIFF